MNILVTGGTGLLGNALSQVNNNNNMFFVGTNDYDLSNLEECKKCFSKYKPDIIIHLASKVLGGISTEIEQFDSLIVNCKIHINVFECCNNFNVKYILTCLTVAMSNADCIDISNINEGPAINSKYHYGYIHSKRLLHTLAIQYEKCNYGKCILLCPVNIYGKEDLITSSRLVPSIYRKIIENRNNYFDISSESERQFIYNKDLSKIIIKFISDISYFDTNSLLIIGNDEKIKIKNIVSEISKTLKIKNTYSFNENKTYSRDVKISELPFTFEYTKFSDGIKEIIL